MAVIRVNKNKNYTAMAKYHLQDKRLSLKAKGLMSVMLSLPDNWDYSINGLVAISTESKKAIETIIKELKKFNYLEIKKVMPDKTKSGRFEYIYNIYEKPKTRPPKQDPCSQGIEKQDVVFCPQYNTKELNTKELNTKRYKRNIKEKDSLENYELNPKTKKALTDFIKMRKQIKAPMTDRAIELLINKLIKMTPEPEIQTQIIEQSIMNGWKSIYPLKSQKKESKTSNPFLKIMQEG